jgi:hypothetical protein
MLDGLPITPENELRAALKRRVDSGHVSGTRAL